MLDWSEIDSVFLDMDGTLLDLHFDNHFWLDHVPRRYAEKNGLTKEQGLDIAMLKEEVQHLFQVQPYVTDFLERLAQQGKRRVLVTNAHQKSLALKMKNTPLAGLLDKIISAHELGLPKEEVSFWEKLAAIEKYDPARTLLIDDNLTALRSAREYGIGHLMAIYKPDSKADIKDVGEFRAIHSFEEIMP